MQKPGRIVKVDALTGAQESVSSGGLFSCPTGIASLANADLIVADPCAKMVIRVYHRTGGQKAVSSGGKFAFPQNVRVATDGSIIVADRDAFGGAGAIIRLDLRTGAQTVMSSGETLLNPTDVALDTNGRLLIADFNSFACGPGGYTAPAPVQSFALIGRQAPHRAPIRASRASRSSHATISSKTRGLMGSRRRPMARSW
jgi:hypothetical protein